MPRQPGKTYPSDDRRWFRVDSEEMAARTADLTDAEFRAFILILAWANENKAHLRDDSIVIARSQLLSVSPNGRESVAKSARVVRELSAKQSWTLREEGAKWVISIRNYSQKQGFAPSKPQRRPNETPATTPTPTTTPTTKRERKARTPKKPAGLCPSELPEPQASQAIKWAEARGTPLAELEFRWGRVRRWSEQKPTVKRTAAGWYSTLQNAVEDGWGGEFSGSAPPPPGESPAQARQRRTHEAAREAQRRFMEANPEPEQAPQLLALEGGAQ